MTHEELVIRAIRWLRSKKHDPVLSGIASCDEIPDSIGWSSRECTVVECKTSLSDFHRDRHKYIVYKAPDSNFTLPYKRVRGRVDMSDWEKVAMKRMGSRRYYMCEPGIIKEATVREHHPDHGLLYVKAKTVQEIIAAPIRTEMRDLENEVKFLRFAIVHLRDNLGKRGVTCNLLKATQYFGDQEGITFRRNPEATSIQ